MRRKRITIVTAVAVAGVAGAAGLATAEGRTGGSSEPAAARVSTGTADVRRADVADRARVNGLLGHAGTAEVFAAGPGTLTHLPPVGAVISRGQAVYEADGRPVLLLYGDRAAWRPIGPGTPDGPDVEQLEANLTALGYGAGLTVDRHYTAATAGAVQRWQRAAGLPATGTVPLGQVVFLPAGVRVGGHDLRPGEALQPGALVVHGTGPEPAVTAQVPPRQVPRLRTGDAVQLILPDGTRRTGTITAVGEVTVPETEQGGNGGGNGGGPPSAPVTIRVDGDVSGFADQAPVQVLLTAASATGVLAVPVTALNAVPGGYEVVVVDAGGTRRVPVHTGLFDESAGLVEVTGPGLAAGQKVRVPGDLG